MILEKNRNPFYVIPSFFPFSFLCFVFFSFWTPFCFASLVLLFTRCFANSHFISFPFWSYTSIFFLLSLYNFKALTIPFIFLFLVNSFDLFIELCLLIFLTCSPSLRPLLLPFFFRLSSTPSSYLTLSRLCLPSGFGSSSFTLSFPSLRPSSLHLVPVLNFPSAFIYPYPLSSLLSSLPLPLFSPTFFSFSIPSSLPPFLSSASFPFPFSSASFPFPFLLSASFPFSFFSSASFPLPCLYSPSSTLPFLAPLSNLSYTW